MALKVACVVCGGIHAEGECRAPGKRIAPERAPGWSRRRTPRGTEISPATRRAVRARAAGVCALCGLRIADGDGEIDHIRPKSRGGSNELGNLRYVHRGCHRRRRSR